MTKRDGPYYINDHGLSEDEEIQRIKSGSLSFKIVIVGKAIPPQDFDDDERFGANLADQVDEAMYPIIDELNKRLPHLVIYGEVL